MSTSEKALPASPIAPGGFPTWLPSMFVKELRQGIRTKGFVAAFVIFQVLMAILMLAAVLLTPYELNPNARTAMLTGVDTAFWMLISVVLLVVTPGRAMAGLKAEIDNRTIDLLVLSHLTAWRIVFGKWASLMAQGLLVLVALMPFGIVRYFTGAVDLASDALRCLLLLVGAGVLTAAGLWASGLPRLFGVAMVGLLVWSQVISGVTLGRMGASLARSPFGSTNYVPALLLAAAMILVFCLLNAVRRIAPPAENYSLLARGLGLLAVVPPVLATTFGAHRDIQEAAFGFGVIYAGVVCLTEMSSNQLPMAVNCRQYMWRGGRIPRFLAIFGLPGWQTAMWFTTLMVGEVLLLVWFIDMPGLSARDRGEISWLVLLIYGALIFPAVFVSLFRRESAPSNKLYFVVIVVMSLIALVALILGETLNLGNGLLSIVSILPVTGVWSAFENFADDIRIPQLVAIALTLALGVRQSRPYWTHVTALSRRRSGRIPGTPRVPPAPPVVTGP